MGRAFQEKLVGQNATLIDSQQKENGKMNNQEDLELASFA